MSNRTYDLIKNTALFIIPVLAFISSMCVIWNVPHSEAICASLTALDTLVGAIVAVAKTIYEKRNEI